MEEWYHLNLRFQKLVETVNAIFVYQVYDDVLTRLKKAYGQVLSRIGDPLEENTLIGPLHSENSLNNYKETIASIQKQGGIIEFGGKVIISINYHVQQRILYSS